MNSNKNNLSSFLHQTAIITFKDWANSKCKEDYDLLHSFYKYKVDSVPNMLFIKDGPSIVRIDGIDDEWIIIFHYRDRIFYTRVKEDIKEIDIFKESDKNIQIFLSTTQDQVENKPTFNPIFENDPSGVLGSLKSRQRCFSLAFKMLKLMSINLCAKDSALYTEEFFIRAKRKYRDNGNDFPSSIKEQIEFLKTNFSPLYDLVVERGGLYGDVRYIKVFGKFENLTSKDLKQGCFIATSVYGSPQATQVIIFTKFRDNYLSGNVIGNLFIRLYYRFSPFLATKIENSEKVKALIRNLLLNPLHSIIKSKLMKTIK